MDKLRHLYGFHNDTTSKNQNDETSELPFPNLKLLESDGEDSDFEELSKWASELVLDI